MKLIPSKENKTLVCAKSSLAWEYHTSLNVDLEERQQACLVLSNVICNFLKYVLMKKYVKKCVKLFKN